MLTVKELHSKMQRISSSEVDDVYSVKAFRARLKERFENSIYFLSAAGRRGELVCFRDNAGKILREVNSTKENTETSIVTAAANSSSKQRQRPHHA